MPAIYKFLIGVFPYMFLKPSTDKNKYPDIKSSESSNQTDKASNVNAPFPGFQIFPDERKIQFVWNSSNVGPKTVCPGSPLVYFSSFYADIKFTFVLIIIGEVYHGHL